MLLCPLLLGGAGLLVLGGCVFDASGLSGRPRESSVLLPDGKVPDLVSHLEGALLERGAPEGLLRDTLAPDQDPHCLGLTCPLGCNAAEKRCYRLQPSNVDLVDLKTWFSQATAQVSQGGAYVFHTDTGEIERDQDTLRDVTSPGEVDKGIYWDVVSQGSGLPELSVFGVRSFSVPAGTIEVQGPRALVIYAVEDVEIGAVMIATPQGQDGGAGGLRGGNADGHPGAACSGGQGQGGDKAGGGHDSGGGGGGRLESGGDGGNVTSSPTVSGGKGGNLAGSELMDPLFGGCGGGGGGGGEGGAGGGGGGAIQISAGGRITISTSGSISVPGAGGLGSSKYAGGGGGGSGGAILFEAAVVTVLGTLAANGGGGGGAGGDGTARDGDDGQLSTQPAGGGQAGSIGGNGGAGGARTTPAGSSAPGHAENGGGGGGAAGRIRFQAMPGQIFVTGVVSPPSSSSDQVGRW